MKIVADTNVLVSALLWKGRTVAVFQLVKAGKVKLFLNPSLLSEFRRVLGYERIARQLPATGKDAKQIIRELFDVAETVVDIPIPPTILDDPSDDHILACALAAGADCIVSGDKHLLRLKRWRGIPILSVREFLSRFN